MNIAFFSTQKYEQPFFERSINKHPQIEICYFEQALNEQTALLAKGFDAVDQMV